MANYDSVKAEIAALIHDNEQQAITAEDVRDAFGAVLDAVNDTKEDEGAIAPAEWGGIAGNINAQTDLKAALDAKQDTIADLGTIRSGAAAGTTAVQPAALATALSDKVDKVAGKGLSQNDFTNADKSKLDSLENYDDTTVMDDITALEGRVGDIEDVIPSAASDSNQLADKAFVNSSVATNTANYISDNGQPFSSLAALQAYAGTVTNNDYAIVVGTDAAGNTTYTRYKYNAGTRQWAEEYVLNNSSFTAVQWAAINSGITGTQLAQMLDGIAAAYVKPQGGIPSTDLAGGVQTSLGKADTAVQPGRLATVATSGSYNDLSDKPAIPSDLNDLSDVNLGTPSNGDVLTYDSATGKWVADAPSGGELSTDVVTDKNDNTKASTPKSVYDFVTGLTGLLSSLTTDDKSNLVAAINEAAQGAGVPPVSTTDISDGADLEIKDENDNILVKFKAGHIQTKCFDSSARDLKVLFFGNSLTQDAVAYLPLLLNEIAPDLNYTLYIWHNGGATLTSQYNTYIASPDTACNCLSIFKKGDTEWTNYSNEKSINWVVAHCDFDILVLQEYGDSSQTDSTIITAFTNITDWFYSNYSKPIRVVSLCDAAARGDLANVTAQIEHYNEVFMESCCSQGIIPAGLAITYACEDAGLAALGDQGYLSPDGVHAQEGLPCLLQSYVVAMWLFDLLGIDKSIWGSKTRITTAIYTALNIPGPNLGTGVVEGTEANYLAAQKAAIKAYKRGLYLVNTAVEQLT